MKHCPQCKRSWASGTICPYCDCALVEQPWIEAPPVGPAPPCCTHMEFALRHAIIRENHGLHFGTDVLPVLLTAKIVACPWCGKAIPQ